MASVSRIVSKYLYPGRKLQIHKENATFLNAIILNSDEIFSRFSSHEDKFRERMRELFIDAVGEEIHKAIEKLYKMLLKGPEFSKEAEAIMLTARNSASLDVVAEEEEMVALRDHWLRRVNNLSGYLETYAQPSSSGDAKGQPGFISVPIFFATNRNEVGGSVKRFYGTQRADTVSWGVMWLSLPDSLKYGEKDALFWRFSRKRLGVPQKKIVQLSTLPLFETCVYNLSNLMTRAGEKECILFVHGYNTTLSNACKRMAQVTYTGNFRGPAFVFSWPSNQSIASYAADEGNAMWAIPDFIKTLKFLMQNLGMLKVHLLAHSMGSRLAVYSLLRLNMQEMAPDSAKIGRVVLAAPDFDMGEFMYLAEDLSQKCERLTLYCSADDQALRLSRSIHGGYPRLGDFRGFMEMATNPRMRALRNMDAIDTTGTDNSWFRHAYVFDACGIILDCSLFLRVGLPPNERKSLILARLPSGHPYWMFETNSSGLVKSAAMSISIQTMLTFIRSSNIGFAGGNAPSILDKPLLTEGEGTKMLTLKEELKDIEQEDMLGIEAIHEELHEKEGAKLVVVDFMVEFGSEDPLKMNGETLLVQAERIEDDGGNDVKVPTNAEGALSMDKKKNYQDIHKDKKRSCGKGEKCN